MIFHASKRGAGPGFCAAAASAVAMDANANKPRNLTRDPIFAAIWPLLRVNSADHLNCNRPVEGSDKFIAFSSLSCRNFCYADLATKEVAQWIFKRN
jgi:hypothetical protein